MSEFKRKPREQEASPHRTGVPLFIGSGSVDPENWRDRMISEHIDANRDDPLMARALLIAGGEGNDDDKRDVLRDTRKRLGNFARRTAIP